MDYYKSMETLKKAFYDFGLKVPFYGAIVVCGDDPLVREVFHDFPKKIIYYGMDKSNDYYLTGERGRYEVHSHDGKKIGDMKLNVSGRHNALNGLAAAIASHLAGVTWEECFSGLSLFKGVDRRFQFRGELGGILFYDDYGHHPTEVKATLQAFKETFPQQKVFVLFQPHRYSRTELCWLEFLDAFEASEKVFVLDIYPAGEKPIAGVDAERLSKEMKQQKGIYVGKFEQALEQVKAVCKPGDVIVSLGAGDVNKFFDLYKKQK
jgi:UDP-N-acetylmuramate--alanine ligase